MPVRGYLVVLFKFLTVSDLSVYFGQISTTLMTKDLSNLRVGSYVPDNQMGGVTNFKAAHMVVGGYNYSDEDMLRIHKHSQPYFNGTIIRKQRSGVLYHDQQAYDGLDVVTLKGTLVSNKGVHPISFGYQAGTYKLDKTRLFEYDDSRKIHVYGSYGNDKDLISSKAKLVYDFNIKNTGMISIRFKPIDVGTQLRTIFSFYKDTDSLLETYVNGSNKLVVKQSQLETFDHANIIDGWNQLVIRWNEAALWLYLNGELVVSRSKPSSFENAVLSVGALLNNNIPTDHFNGQFEMLAYSDHFFSHEKVDMITHSFQTISHESEYDLLGRKESDELSIGNTKRTAEYTYKRPNGDTTKTSFEVEHMKTLANQNIYYKYDALGNVTEIDTPEGTYEYKYDYMGRLVEEYHPVLNQTIKMEYDKQNITSKVHYVGKSTDDVKRVIYTTNDKDQLEKITTLEGNQETTIDIDYDERYIGNPLSIGSIQLTWEGRRLKQILDGDDTFIFTYNEQGLRTKKSINGVETKYYLQGSNIISEEKDNQVIHYTYNEQNQLVGFEHQHSKYFYVRDLLGIIRNVIDINGNIVVTYNYDAWGNHKVYDSSNVENTSPSFIGNINPFRYKGYYYDVETDWYYLQTRYYSPLLSRFINMDHTQYLEPGSIDGVNLFGYCNNNPVMYADPSGKFNINKLWGKVKDYAKKVVNKVVDYFLEKSDIKFDYGFGFIENQLRTGEIDKLWDAKWSDGVGSIKMPSLLNLVGINSTYNVSGGFSKDTGLFLSFGHSTQIGSATNTATFGVRPIPLALATVAIEGYEYAKEKIKSVDWGVIGGYVTVGVAILVVAAAIYFAPYLAPLLLKVAVPALASYIIFLNL